MKDIIALAGVPLRNGGAANWTPDFDATIVTRILDASATITGKATCENSCLDVVSDTAFSGVVHNPHADGYSAGGSSSGSARLVATGSVTMSMGTDQGGSIRVPASQCGIVGLKPTWGLIPYTGILSLVGSIDHTGPMTKNVEDCVRALEVVAGPDGIDDRQPFGFRAQDKGFTFDAFQSRLSNAPSGARLQGLKIGVLAEGFQHSTQDPFVERITRRSIEGLEKLGATIVDVSIPIHSASARIWMCAFPYLVANQGLQHNGIGRKGLALTAMADATRGKIGQKQFQNMGTGAQNTYLRGLFLQQRYGPGLSARCVNQLRKLNV